MQSNRTEFTTPALWIAACIGTSFICTFGFACVTPLAGLAALAGLYLPRREALLTTGATWAANQAVGFLFLHYPLTANCLGWGVALGAAALLATIAAGECNRLQSHAARLVAGLFAAFIVYEGASFAVTPILGGESTFTADIVWGVFAINALTFCILAASRAAFVAFDLRARTVALLPSRP
ncbi:MAG: hypothetical protein JOZ16_18755 [Methylobacteriaceae bacterium]|nr:hypothetical protein [Methylobacteriaceae bacterium]